MTLEKPIYFHESHEKNENIFQQAHKARLSLTPLEHVFWKQTHSRWPTLHWRRYAPVTIQIGESKSTWYAPFLCVAKKLIVVIQDREEFPYRIYGYNRDLYARQGYTVLDFSEDFSCQWNQSVWDEAMRMIDTAVTQRKAA